MLVTYLNSVDDRFTVEYSGRTAELSRSPVWAIESPSREYLSDVEPVDNESGPPPPSQVRGSGSGMLSLLAMTDGNGEVQGGGKRSTPSTISDDVEDDTVEDGEGQKRSPRNSATSKKRALHKLVEVDGQDLSEDGQEHKRKQRKSARLS